MSDIQIDDGTTGDELVVIINPAASAEVINQAKNDTLTYRNEALIAKDGAETAQLASETAQTGAETAETNASTSASSANTSSNTAGTYASTATTQAGIATTQASNASTYADASAASAVASDSSATASSGSASSANNSAISAGTSETNAATSESNAADSASQASISRTATDNTYGEFTSIWLGKFITAEMPTVSVDEGSMAYDLTLSSFRTWNGAYWSEATKGDSVTDITSSKVGTTTTVKLYIEGIEVDSFDIEDGYGWTSGAYAPSTGIVTFVSDHGLGFATEDLRGQEAYTDAEIKTKYENNADALVNMPAVIGTVTHTTNIQEKFNHTESAGISFGCDLTDHENGLVSITAGEAYIRATDDHHATLYIVEVGATTNLSIANDNQLNLVYLDYNSGVPVFAVTTDPNVITITDKVPAFAIFREGNLLHIRDVREHNIDNTAKHQKHMFFTEREKHSSGGFITDAGTRHFAISASVFYFQLVPLASAAFDSSVGTFSRYYRDGGTGFTKQTSQTLIDNFYYDDGSGTLAEIGNAKFGVEWIYLIIDNNHTEVVNMYGTESYASVAAADEASAPADLPNIVAQFGTLIGRTIILKSDTEILGVQSALTETFSASGATVHNNTTGIQGGAVTDYQHLTTAQVALVDGSLQDADIGVNVEAYDATILKDADIDSTVQGYSVLLDPTVTEW